jgi:hypothetical protein
MGELVQQAGLRGKGHSDRWAQFGSEHFPERRPSTQNPEALVMQLNEWRSPVINA